MKAYWITTERKYYFSVVVNCPGECPTITVMSEWRCEEAWCKNGGIVNPFLTYICGFLLSQLKFLLGIFKSLGVLVQLILSSLQLLLQSYQIVFKLKRVSVRDSFRGDQRGDGVAWARTGARARTVKHGTGRERTGQDREKKERRVKVRAAHARQDQIPWWRPPQRSAAFPQQFGTPQTLYLFRLQ